MTRPSGENPYRTVMPVGDDEEWSLPSIRKDYDVIVAGGGPAGTTAARLCAEEGLSTLCIEEHGAIGHPVQCAGLLSSAALRECEVSERSVLHAVRGARVVSSLGGSFSFDAGAVKAYVVDRGILDREMAVRAANAGVDFLMKTSAVGFADGKVETRGVAGRHFTGCRVLIAADGPRSRFSRIFGLKRAKMFLAGLQVECVHPVSPEYVEIHPDAAPDFFGWVIPAGGNYARIGLCSRASVRERFNRFVSPMAGAVISEVAGTVPLGPMPVTYARGVVFVGDAAGLAKPTSGGGVYTGVRSARHAAAAVSAAIRAGDLSPGYLSRYQKAWQEDFGRELAMGLRFLSVRSQLGPADIQTICRVMNDPGIIDVIVNEGDMDRPAKVLLALARNRKMVRLYGLAVRALGSSLIH